MANETPGKGKKTFSEVDIKNEGNVIVLPDGMNEDEAMIWLSRKKEEKNLKIAPSEVFDCYPLDGAVQLRKALKEVFGWTQLLPTHTWFGEIPPSILNVQVGPDPILDVERVPWGNMTIPKLKGGAVLTTSAAMKDGRWHFVLTGQIRQGEKPIWEEIVAKTKQYILKESIYKGKAIRIDSFPPSKFDPTSGVPKFIQLSNFKEDDLILPTAVKRDVRAAVFTLIKRADEAKALGIPTKRAVLLSGAPGVGKTLTATIAAPLCVEHGRTMAYVTNPTFLTQTIRFLLPYGRSLVFVEDIDQIAGGVERTDEINDLLNTIDGVDTKEADMLFVLTTNYPERLNQAFKRHGRSDWVINIPAPDGAAAAELLMRYGKGVLDITGEDALEVGNYLAEVEMIPASIAEVVQRAKLYALEAAGDDDIIVIHKDDLMAAASGVKEHVKMMRAKPVEPRKLIPAGAIYVHPTYQQQLADGEYGSTVDIHEVDEHGHTIEKTEEEEKTA